jgi:NAD+ kinase
MKTVGVIPNIKKDINLDTARRVVSIAESAGHRVFVSGEAALIMGGQSGRLNLAECDFVVVIGGDGTLLNAARFAAKTNTPLLGVNAGNLGFLTSAEARDVDIAMERALSGGFRLERRMMAQVCGEGGEAHALNDITVMRSGGQLSAFGVYINGEFMDTYAADGVVIATPTGSTAYNLSAGGPIARPEQETLLLTPVCPHTLYARPWVLAPGDEVTIKIERGECQIAADGRPLALAPPVTVRKSPYATTLMIIGRHNFYEVLRRKMIGR